MTDLPPDVYGAQKGSFVAIAEHDWDAADFFTRDLNDQLEYEISVILREIPDINTWGRVMCEAVGGYRNRQELQAYIDNNLKSVREDSDDPNCDDVGAERDFLKLFDDARRAAYRPDHDPPDLELIRTRIDLLAGFRGSPKMATLSSIEKRLFYKIYYTYKLYEALVGQVGYYNGSLELEAGLDNDFEYWMYLTQMKLRKPSRQWQFQAPKTMKAYKTPPDSLLPWNNQLSFSYGFHEFDNWEIPHISKSGMEKSLLRLILRKSKDDKDWTELMGLLGWNAADSGLLAERKALSEHFKDSATDGLAFPAYISLRQLRSTIEAAMGSRFSQRITLENMLLTLGRDEKKREVKLKAFFTLHLGMTWSDELLSLEENAFHVLVTDGTKEEKAEASKRVQSGAIKDPRLSAWMATPLQRLADAKKAFNVVGKNSNIVLQPDGCMGVFRQKLQRMSTAERTQLYANISTDTLEIDEIGRQAQKAANDWLASALKHRKPIYTGPSGHALTYITLYLSAAKRPDHPTLEECRLVLLAALIGKNRHHSYDEVMIGCTGITAGGQKLKYMDRKGYRDVLVINGSTSHPIAVHIRKAARDIAAKQIKSIGAMSASEKQKQPWLTPQFVETWLKATTGQAPTS